MTYNAKSTTTTTTTFNLVVLAFAIMLVGGLVAIPIIEDASADNGNHKGQHKNGNNGHHRGSDV